MMHKSRLQERLGEDYAVRNFGCNGASVRCDADLPYVQTLEDGVRPVIREVAGECGLPCVDLVDLFEDARYCYDGVHPNGEGVRLMMEEISSILHGLM